MATRLWAADPGWDAAAAAMTCCTQRCPLHASSLSSRAPHPPALPGCGPRPPPDKAAAAFTYHLPDSPERDPTDQHICITCRTRRNGTPLTSTCRAGPRATPGEWMKPKGEPRLTRSTASACRPGLWLTRNPLQTHTGHALRPGCRTRALSQEREGPPGAVQLYVTCIHYPCSLHA